MIILVLFIVNTSGKVFSQNSFPSPELRSTLYDSLKTDSIKTTNQNEPRPFRMKKNPWVAVGLSALIPGAGQMYNQSYWKIPIILGVGGYLGYEIYRNNDRYNQYEDLYIQSQAEDPNGNIIYKQQRDNFRDQRDRFIIFAALFYVINLVDAYVDAHLYDFDVSEDLKVQIMKGSELMKMSFSF
jgi:hypothetical protein